MAWWDDLSKTVGNVVSFGGVGAADQSYQNAINASESAYNAVAEQSMRKRAQTAATAPPQTVTPGPDYASMQKQIASLLSQINQRTYAPKLDIVGINAQARSAAESNVNPYYVKTLNDFLAGQAAKRQQQQKQYDINLKTIEQNLKTNLEDTALQRTRTGEDTQQKLDDVATATDEFQTDSGTEFDQARANQAKLLAAAGLTTSGVGKRQMTAGNEARNTAEARQQRVFETTRKTAQLFKDRTFEDLIKSDEIANIKAEGSKEQAKFDLDSFITNQGFETEGKKAQLEGERLGAVASEQRNQGQLLVNSFINSIQNPAQRQAALEAYGGLF